MKPSLPEWRIMIRLVGQALDIAKTPAHKIVYNIVEYKRFY